MSSSTFHVTDDSDNNDVLTLLIAPDGRISPDRETVHRILSARSSTDINLVTMKEMDGAELNVIVDNLRFVTSDSSSPCEMSELARNLCNFRMDHDYTPFTSPSQVPTAIREADEITNSLNMLEDGSLDPQLTNEPLTKITKIVKGKAQTIFVNSKEKQRMINAGILKERPSEKVFKKPKPPLMRIMQPATPEEELSAVFAGENTKTAEKDMEKSEKAGDVSSGDKKSTPKKEKKAAKTLPPDLALFSTPDILRRVDKETAKSPIAKPAKVSSEARARLSGDGRGSLDERRERRASADVGVSSKPTSSPSGQPEAQVSVQEFSETMSNSNESIGDSHLEPMPSAEDIRAMIHNENTKSFTIGTVMPETTQLASAGDPANLSLDSSGLELDQTLLDNINNDLSEDMLYQVAQSLVDSNTDLQNVIDKSLTEGNLHPIVAASGPTSGGPALASLASSPTTKAGDPSASSALQKTETRLSASGHALRTSGRVVHIPPIERPATRSRNKRASAAGDAAALDSKPPKNATRRRQEVEAKETDDDDDDDDDGEEESDDDPNKLWCVCNQPHNNRFMICCDTCEEWYHGKCVNVTKAMGQMMEDEGKEWMCVYCKDPNLRRPKAALRRLRKASKASSNENSNAKAKLSAAAQATSAAATTPSASKEVASSKPANERKNAAGCVVCGKASRSNSIYCSDACILKHAQGVEKVVVFNRKTGHLLSGSNAPSAAKLDKWLQENPSYEILRSSNKLVTKVTKPSQLTQSKLKLIKNTGDAGASLAVNKKGVNVGVLPHVPKATKSPQPVVLNSTVKAKANTSTSGLSVVPKSTSSGAESHGAHHESRTKAKLVSPPPARKASPPVEKAKVKMIQTKLVAVKKEAIPMPLKTPKARQAECSPAPRTENLRDTVRKTFFEQLSNRLKDADDLQLTDDELKQVSDEIESQLYKCFADTGQKYRNKYRSLIFNIKDPKNQTLWRRICEKAINPYQLVRLSHDDLASQELALWREREAKHQLDMIKKSELELLNCNRQYVFKTHKGETVFEDDRGKDQVTDVIANAVNDGAAPGASGESAADADGERKSRDKSGKRSRHDRIRSKEHRSAKHRSRSKEDRKRRSRSRDRSRHAERRRSRSRDRHKERRSSHKSSRHRKDEDGGKKDKVINTEKLDKRSKEILEQLVDKQIVPPLEDGVWKQQEEAGQAAAAAAESDSDHEPSSTVTIPTPPRVTDPDDVVPSTTSAAPSKPAPAVTTLASEAEVPSAKAAGPVPAVDNNNARHGNVVPEQPLSQAALWRGTINMIDVANIAISAFAVSGDCAGLGDELPKTLDIVGRISPATVWDYIGKMKMSNSKSISILRLCAASMEERTAYLSLYGYLSTRQRLGVVKCVNKRVKDFYILPLAASSPIPDVILPITGPGFEAARPALLVGVIVRDRRKRMLDVAAAVGQHQSKRIRVEVLNKGTAIPPPQTPAVTRSYTPPPSREIRKLPVPEITEDHEEDMDEPYSPADSDPDTTLDKAPTQSASFLETSMGDNQSSSFEPFAKKFETIPGLDVTPSLPSNSVDLQKKMVELDEQIAAQKAEIDKVSMDLVTSGNTDLESSSLAGIALPKNLQQILESIKCIGNKAESEYQPEASVVGCTSSDLTIPLLLPKMSSRSASIEVPKVAIEMERSSGSVLSTLSEEELIKKAAEMLGETEMPAMRKLPPCASHQLEFNQPPIPGLED